MGAPKHTHPSSRLSHFTFHISHFTFRISHFAFRIADCTWPAGDPGVQPSVVFSCQILDLVEPLQRLSVIHVAGTKGKVSPIKRESLLESSHRHKTLKIGRTE